jgi:hypothetical protein
MAFVVNIAGAVDIVVDTLVSNIVAVVVDILVNNKVADMVDMDMVCKLELVLNKILHILE